MKHGKGIIITTVIIVVICFVAVPLGVTVLLKPETKKKIIDHLNDNCKIMMDINIELVSASYVSTKLKCRGEFIKSNTDNLENNFELSGKDSMCLWGGNIIYSEKDVTVRMKS